MKKQILAPTILALFVASAAHAGATFDTAAGTLNLGADVEFDYTVENDQTDDNVLTSANDETDFYSSGRLLLDLNGEKVLDNGNFAGFKLNPVWGQNGNDAADDVWIKFGQKDNWNIQAGHFEASDLSPAGQDTYVAGVNTDGATMYRANVARGRTSGDGDGQVTFTQMTDSANFELTAQSQGDGDLIILRPVMTFAADTVSVSLGAEVPVVDSEDENDWVGFGAGATAQASDLVTIHARVALKTGDDALTNADDEIVKGSSMTAGLGAQIENFYIAAIYGNDDYDSGESVNETQIYASYKIPSVLDIDNFAIYLGAGYAMADDSDNDVVGGRVRLKYTF